MAQQNEIDNVGSLGEEGFLEVMQSCAALIDEESCPATAMFARAMAGNPEVKEGKPLPPEALARSLISVLGVIEINQKKLVEQQREH